MWYRTRCGIDFSERWHVDPLYRGETLVQMRHELNRSFPDLQLGGPNPDEAPATLDGIYGALTIARIFGVGSEFYADNWPAARHEYLSDAQAAALEVPDLSNDPTFVQIMDQADTIAREFGRIEGYVNWQGVLNNAFRLRGDQVFLDMMMQPEMTHHLLAVITETMIQGMRLLYARQRESGVVVRHATVSNCVVNMVSPDLYREFLFPYDRQISEAFDHFGIHNCAWNVDPYIEDYARIEKLGYVDMGLDSDLEKARACCPNARRAIMYKPTDLASKSEEDLAADLHRIREELSPCDIVMADIEHDTPDDRVMTFHRLTQEALQA